MNAVSKIATAIGRLIGPGGRRRDATASAPRDPPEGPQGWLVGPPDFVGVGAAGSGTSWWDALIHDHPQVQRAAGLPNEVHFFDRFWDGSWDDLEIDRYHALFARAAGKIAGEWTPGYMVDFWIPALLRRAAPDARLLVMLRDPVERFRSRTTRTDHRPTIPQTPRAAANSDFQIGCYADQLLRLWAAFPRDQVLVLLYEQCLADPATELRRTFDFLGSDPAAANQFHADRPIEETTSARIALTDAQRSALARMYAPENERLGHLLPELDLSRWTTAA